MSVINHDAQAEQSHRFKSLKVEFAGFYVAVCKYISFEKKKKKNVKLSTEWEDIVFCHLCPQQYIWGIVQKSVYVTTEKAFLRNLFIS